MKITPSRQHTAGMTRPESAMASKGEGMLALEDF